MGPWESALFRFSFPPTTAPPLQQPLGQQETAAQCSPHLVMGQGGGGEKTET